MRLCHWLIAHNIAGRGQTPKKVTRTDLYFLRIMDREAVNLSFLLAFYLFRHAKGRKSGAQMFGGHFIARLANHFGLLTEAGLQSRYLGFGSPERQQAAMAGAPEGVEGAHAVDEDV
ncbi:hypothetical protein Tco_0230057, partial [Tanacetum coccineum]